MKNLSLYKAEQPIANFARHTDAASIKNAGYHEFYGLRSDPFESNANQDFIYQHTAYERIKASLISGVKDGSRIMLLTGKPGTGKSLVISSALNQLPESYRIVTITKPVKVPEDLMVRLCDDLGLGFIDRNLQDLLPTFLAYLRITGRLGNKLLLVLECAEELSGSVLLLIRKLIGSTYGNSGNIRVILAGQSRLALQLNEEKNESLRRFIGFYSELMPLSRDETDSYLRHRLAVSGARNPDEIFSESAIKKLFELSQGIPRDINRLCNRILRIGAIRRWNQISSVDLDKLSQRLSLATAEQKIKEPYKAFSVFSNHQTIRACLEDDSPRADKKPEIVVSAPSREPAKEEKESVSDQAEQPDTIVEDTRNDKSEASLDTDISRRAIPEEMLKDYCKIIDSMRVNGAKRSHQVIGITSPIANQGCSTTAAILSLLVAEGKFVSPFRIKTRNSVNQASDLQFASDTGKTLLIDCHFLAPSLARKFKIKSGYGLRDILVGRTSPENAISKIPSANLDIITAGGMDSSMHESFSPERFAKLLMALRKRYRQIILDLPPILEHGDAITLSRCCDSIVLVARSRGCRIHSLEKACDDLKKARVEVLGGIINRRKVYVPGWLYKRI